MREVHMNPEALEWVREVIQHAVHFFCNKIVIKKTLFSQREPSKMQCLITISVSVPL